MTKIEYELAENLQLITRFSALQTSTDTRYAATPVSTSSLTIDADLLDACGMRPSDAILVANCETGARFETYVFRGEPGSGVIGVNGAAAHLASVGDRIIIIHWAHLDDEEYADHFPRVLIMQADNTIGEALSYEPQPSVGV